MAFSVLVNWQMNGLFEARFQDKDVYNLLSPDTQDQHDLSSLAVTWWQDKMLLMLFGSKDGNLTYRLVKKTQSIGEIDKYEVKNGALKKSHSNRISCVSLTKFEYGKDIRMATGGFDKTIVIWKIQRFGHQYFEPENNVQIVVKLK